MKQPIHPLPDGRGSEVVTERGSEVVTERGTEGMTEPRPSGSGAEVVARLFHDGYLVVRFLSFFVVLMALEAQPGAYTIDTFAGSDPWVEGGTALSAIFAQNQGLAVDSQGSVYVSDAGNNRVSKITTDGLIHTVASTGLNHPYGVALDNTGRLYVADLGNQCVKRVNLDRTVTVVVAKGLGAPRNLAFDVDGSMLISDFGKHQVFRYSAAGILSVVAGTGIAGFSGDNGPATAAQLNAPAGLAVDAAGALYIADSGNNRVRKIVNGVITSAMTVGSPVAVSTGRTVAGQTVYVVGANYLGTLTEPAGTFSGVQDVALDAAGNVYYITVRQVEEIGPQGLLAVIAGSGADPNYGGDGGPATASRLNRPSGLALDSAGSLYIADTLNSRIRRVSPAGLMETVLDSSTVSAPQGLALDAQGSLYIADTGNLRVLKWTSDGSVSTEVGGLSGPRALAVDPAGALYIADTTRVLRVAGSAVSTVAAEQAVGLAFDPDGSLLVATSSGILKMTTAGVLVSVSKSSGPQQAMAVTGSGDYLTAAGNQVLLDGIAIAGGMAGGFAGDGGPATTALLNTPGGLVVDSHGVIYVVDTANNRVRTLTPPPIAPLTVVNAASLAPGAIAANEIVTLFGSGFPAIPAVLIGGLPAQVFYAGTTQINALVPAGVAGTSATVQVSGVAAANVLLAPVAPGLFAAVLNGDGSVNGPGNPAARESVVTFYATGLGTGLSSLTMTIGGYVAEILFAGNAPGFAGLEQLNVQVPGGFAPVGQLAVLLTVAGEQASSTIDVR